MSRLHVTAAAVSSARVLRAAAPPRRGVLLLVVLSLLTLFLMLGAAYIVSATRAREAARAYSRLTFGGDEARVPHARLLDAVLVDVLAGSSTALKGTGYSGLSAQFESLLADKYGTNTVSGSATGVSLSGPVLTGTVQFASSLRPTDLNGRVLTFLQPGRAATSHRVIRATGSGPTNASATQFTLHLDTPPRMEPFAIPVTPVRVIVNGREFDGTAGNENWDGYDFANNSFLALVRSSTGSISSSDVLRGSYVNIGSNGRFVVGSGTYTFSPSGTSGGGAAVVTTGTDFNGDLIPDVADNDNDGVADGVFMDFGLPDVTDGYGNAVQLRASVLVLPLDGRFNVNAHGSLAPVMYTGTHSGWTTLASATAQLATTPLGSGYGPAEVSSAQLRTGSSAKSPLQTGATFATSENPFLITITGGPASRLNGKRSGTSGSRYASNQDTQRIGVTEGRFGERGPSDWTSIQNRTLSSGSWFARPGVPGVDDEASRMNDQRAVAAGVSLGIPAAWWTGTSSWAGARGVFNSPPDLHGRMKMLTLSATASAVVPPIVFAQPEWSTASDPRETKDDPYEMELDTRRGHGGWLRDPATGGTALGSLLDNPFTPAELEAVLRPYDIDTNRVPPRLAAMLGSAAEESRLKVTTDSWDTTAITGTAAANVATWLTTTTGSLYGTNALSGIIGGEVSRGERFDLNRPFSAADGSNAGYPAGTLTSGTYHAQRLAYCKDLFTLLMALNNSAAADQLAQWTANVAEWRDADSRIVPFEYDTTPQDGWGVDGDVSTDEGGSRAVAWGAERPEIVITEAFAWRNSASSTGGMSISLHRPWNAVAYGSGSTNLLPAEPCDYALDTLSAGASGNPQNVVNLGKKPRADLYSAANAGYPDVSGNTYPIWRLRLVAGGSTSYVRFDTGTAAPGEFVDPSVTSGSMTPKLGVDSTVTVLSGDPMVTGSGVGSGSVSLTATGSTRTIPGLKMPGTATSGTVFLERLSDFTLPLTPDGTIPGTSITGSAVWYGTAPSTSPVRYIPVDAAPVSVNETGGNANFTGTIARRSTSAGATAFWRTPSASGVSANNGGTIPLCTPLTTGSTAWLPWPNRPFVSSAELLLVPQGTAVEILQNYQRLSPALAGSVALGRSVPVQASLLFDAVHVPTRFAGVHTTVTNQPPAAVGIDPMITTVNQLSSFREPGRVNLNVVPSDDVWNAVVAGPLAGPVVTGTAARLSLTGSNDWTPAPATSLLGILAVNAVGTTVVSDTTTTVSGTSAPMPTTVLAWDKNPMHEIYTATRLANTATPRSNVFGVWITLRESVPNDPDSVKLRRAFYIIDRSIPVGFEPDKANNVWDCVRVRRIIE